MSGHIAGFRPGEKVPVTYLRNGKEATASITLKGEKSKVDYSYNEAIGDRLGLELEDLDSKKATQYAITGGVVVKKIREGGPFSGSRMETGFIITTVNGRDIKNSEDFAKALSYGNGKVKLEGMYPGWSGSYTYQINIDSDSEY